jgi:hypothetical protein
MKALKTIGATLTSLLAWACVLGVLFLGATNAHAQGFPVKPRFQDVRIGFTTFADCEAYFGAGNCDLTAELGIFSQGGFATPNNLAVFDVNADGTLNAASANIQGGSFVADVAGFANLISDSNINVTTNDGGGGTITLTTDTTGDIVMRPGDDFDLQAAGDAVEIGVGGGAYEVRLVFGDVILNAADDVTIQPVDTVEIVGDDVNMHPTTSMNIDTPIMCIDPSASTQEFCVLSGSVQINAETSISAAGAGQDIALSANDTALIAGGGSVQLSSSGGSISLDAGAGTDEITVTSGAVAIAGTTTVNGSAVCTVDGTNCPSAAIRTFGRFTNGGSCTTALGSNIDSCSRSAQGILTIGFTTSFAQAPACTASATGDDQISLRVTSSASGVVIRTYQDGAGLEDKDVSLLCEGNFPI